MKVTALLVSHNGARWLPVVLAGLEASTELPQEIIAIDTGSGDESVAIVERVLGTVHQLDPSTSYAEAVRAGLELAGPAEPGEWVWLLHDDGKPAPDCFAILRAEAEAAPDEVAILGPKLREWPSLKRLLELGVTLSGTGKRETGLERGEYDQGQHDENRDVLAVNTAGMLVRRSVLETIGFDQRLPFFGNDIDFGWRAASAGHTARIVPLALLFHAEAAHRDLRQSPFTHRPRRDERAGAIYTLLVNGPGATLPFRALRLFIGGLLRALGFLLVRAVGEARDEVSGLFAVFLHPGRIIGGRRARKGHQVVPHSEIKPLLAPFWLPYRHGLDFVADVGSAVASTASDAAARRTENRGGGVPAQSSSDDDDLPEDSGLLTRLVTSPRVWAFVGLIALALVASRDLLSGDPLQGGALLPAPDGVGQWWSSYFSANHLVGTGSDAPAPAYLLPLAFLGTVLLGNPGLLVTVIFVLSVPLTVWTALRFLRRVVPGTWAPLWGAAAYSLVPALSGAVHQGRLGTVVAAMLLPVVASSALKLDAREIDRRWRAAWRTTAGLALVAAFAPTAWLVAVIVVVIAIIALPRLRNRDDVLPLLIIVGAPLVLLLPWVLGIALHPGAWLVEAGRPGVGPVHPTILELLAGRSGGPGSAPLWLSLGLPLAGAAALIRSDTRARVAKVWVVIAVAAVMLALASRISVSLPGIAGDFRPWSGFLIVLMQGGFVLAAVIAADGVGALVSRASFTWRQPIGVVAFAAALLAPALGAGYWVAYGSDGPLERAAVRDVPTYMSQLASGRDTGGVLVLKGGARTGIEYSVLRNGSLRLGDDAILALTPPDEKVSDLVERLLSAARSDDAAALASYGVTYVYAPAPVSDAVSGGLDASNGFSGASAPDQDTRAWRVDATPSVASVHDHASVLRQVLLALQVLAIIACIVLALPSRKL